MFVFHLNWSNLHHSNPQFHIVEMAKIKREKRKFMAKRGAVFSCVSSRQTQTQARAKDLVSKWKQVWIAEALELVQVKLLAPCFPWFIFTRHKTLVTVSGARILFSFSPPSSPSRTAITTVYRKLRSEKSAATFYQMTQITSRRMLKKLFIIQFD